MTVPYPDELVWDDILEVWITEEEQELYERERKQLQDTWESERYSGLL